MRFLDANIFIYAYYRPKKQLTEKEEAMKDQAKKIISNVSQGKEQVTTTVVHISEIVNILMDVTKNAYFAAAELGQDLKLEPNDALAVDIMRLNAISEIYSFDEHFNNIDGITKLPIV